MATADVAVAPRRLAMANAKGTESMLDVSIGHTHTPCWSLLGSGQVTGVLAQKSKSDAHQPSKPETKDLKHLICHVRHITHVVLCSGQGSGTPVRCPPSAGTSPAMTPSLLGEPQACTCWLRGCSEEGVQVRAGGGGLLRVRRGRGRSPAAAQQVRPCLRGVGGRDVATSAA